MSDPSEDLDDRMAAAQAANPNLFDGEPEPELAFEAAERAEAEERRQP